MTLGAPGDEATHRRVLDAVMVEATREHAAGTIVDLDFEWTQDDLRDRQLRRKR
jgi:hypothetical protein